MAERNRGKGRPDQFEFEAKSGGAHQATIDRHALETDEVAIPRSSRRLGAAPVPRLDDEDDGSDSFDNPFARLANEDEARAATPQQEQTPDTQPATPNDGFIASMGVNSPRGHEAMSTAGE